MTGTTESTTPVSPAEPPLPNGGEAAAGDDRAGALRGLWAGTRRARPVIALTIALAVYVSFSQSTFLTSENLQNMLVAVSVLWLMSIGQTFALLTGGADLSMGALAALIGILLAKLLGGSLPELVCILIALGFGAVVGAAFNGNLIGRAKLSFFIVTLATATTISGIVLIWSNQESTLVNSSLINAISIDKYLGISAPIWIMAITLLVAIYVQRRTYFGRNLYAIGGSVTASQLSGIRVERNLVAVYAVCGLCAAMAGVISVGLVGSAGPAINQTIALQAIAAVLLGGTSLFGGSGGIGGTVCGVLFIGVLQNALNLSGVEAAWQEVITGVILVVAVLAVPGATGGNRFGDLRRRFKRSNASETVPV